jgi:hypothetical protein
MLKKLIVVLGILAFSKLAFASSESGPALIEKHGKSHDDHGKNHDDHGKAEKSAAK